MFGMQTIWADGVALRGREVAPSYRELVIVTMKKTYKKNTNKGQLKKLSLLKGSHIIKSKIGKQYS